MISSPVEDLVGISRCRRGSSAYNLALCSRRWQASCQRRSLSREEIRPGWSQPREMIPERSSLKSLGAQLTSGMFENIACLVSCFELLEPKRQLTPVPRFHIFCRSRQHRGCTIIIIIITTTTTTIINIIIIIMIILITSSTKAVRGRRPGQRLQGRRHRLEAALPPPCSMDNVVLNKALAV